VISVTDQTATTAQLMSIGELSELIQSQRTSGNQRRYHRNTLRRLAFIRASQHTGIPLAVIGGVLALLPTDASPTKEVWDRASQCWSKELNARIAAMERMRDRFTRCIGCGCLSFDECALVNPDDALAAQGPGPHRLLNS
jgi:MerR family redox-sensitive transcriptional activator SoxR